MNINPDFLLKMQKLLGAEYDEFEKSLQQPPVSALRVNTLKISVENAEKTIDFLGEPVSWCSEGFYYDTEKIGLTKPYLLGLVYPQDASATAPAEMLGVVPGDRVLDLCAAPGGKSIQLAAKLQGKGLLVSNEINPQRCRVLFENIERSGVKNAVVLCENPQKLENRFESFFDKILVDAPCSGEGMIRKEPYAAEMWNTDINRTCALRQKNILESAAKMLAQGGVMVYSTCTFSKEENEDLICEFLEQNKDFAVQSVNMPQMADGYEPLKQAKRAMFHRVRGEGQFMVKLKKCGGNRCDAPLEKKVKAADCKPFSDFKTEFMSEDYFVYLSGENVYISQTDIPSLAGLKFLTAGIFAGKLKKGRFEPQQHLAMCMTPQSFKNAVNFTDEQLFAYYRGNTVSSGKRSWCLVCSDNFPAGFAKGSDGILKNHYPKGLRLLQ